MAVEQRAPGGRIPDFFIVGAPKCGTTALYRYLRVHPQVFMPFLKEPLYFGSDLTHRYGRLTEEEYLALFAEAEPGQRVGEASAWYLYSACAAEEIRNASPDASIIIMLRNPVDVMYAQHSQLLFNGQEVIPDFAEALRAESERAAGRRLPPGSFRVENLFYRRMASFSSQVERYLQIFPRDRVHVIVFEELKDEPERMYAATLRFLGVDESFTPSIERINVNKRVKNRFLQRLIWDPPLLRSMVPVLRRYPIVHRLRARLLAMNSEAAARQPMDPELRRQLQDEFAPEVERLGRLIDRDLSRWTSQT